jgi:hypothetical protein
MPASRVTRWLGQGGHQQEILPRGEERREIKGLEDKTDFSGPVTGALPVRQGRHVDPRDVDHAGVRGDQAAEL